MTTLAPLRTLAGSQVISLSQFLMGPAGVQYLADLGADVIKIEPLGGAWERHWSGGDLYLNGESVFFLMSHRNTRSIAVNLKRPEGQAVARRLIAGADVLVENFRPGVMARLGLGYDQGVQPPAGLRRLLRLWRGQSLTGTCPAKTCSCRGSPASWGQPAMRRALPLQWPAR